MSQVAIGNPGKNLARATTQTMRLLQYLSRHCSTTVMRRWWENGDRFFSRLLLVSLTQFGPADFSFLVDYVLLKRKGPFRTEGTKEGRNKRSSFFLYLQGLCSLLSVALSLSVLTFTWLFSLFLSLRLCVAQTRTTRV